MLLHYCSAPAGSGKTYQMVRKACQMARNGKVVLFAQPTTELIDKTVRDELPNHASQPRYRVIHGGTVKGGGVAKELAQYLRHREDDGEIIFTTHQVLQFVPYWTKKSKLHLMIDECPQVIRHISHRLPKTHNLITEDIILKPYNCTYGNVEVKNNASLNIKARNKDEDDVYGALAETMRLLNNNHWESFSDFERYNNLCNGTGRNLAFHSVLKPSIFNGFGSVFIAAACFEHSAVYKLWSEAGAEFIHDDDFASKLRFGVHGNGNLITIHYVMEQDWSKKRRTKTLDDGTVVQDLFLYAARQLFGTDSFLWQANSEYKLDPFGSQGTRLPNAPHGLNEFSHLHDIVFVSSLNPSPDHFKFLRSRGLSDDEIRAAIYYATAYQSVMRTSIRNPADISPKRIVVPDRGLADYLCELFPGSKVEWLDAGLEDKLFKIKKGGRPRKHASNAARRKAQRVAAKEKKLQLIQDLIALQPVHYNCEIGCGCTVEDRGAGIGIDITTSIGTPDHFHGSIFANKRSTDASCYLSCHHTEEFMLALEQMHLKRSVEKEGQFLISPAMFDPSLSTETNRGLQNIVYCRHLFLDFEDGDLKPDEFPKLFPQLKMLVTNTFGHTNEKPRFRVIIPTSQPVSAEAYQSIFDKIVEKLESSDFEVTRSKKIKAGKLRSGLDWSKRTPCSLFFAPVQAKKNPNDSFFNYYEGPGREILDPIQLIENTTVSLQPEMIQYESDDRPQVPNQAAVDAAIADWQSTPRGTGNYAFFLLGKKLQMAGLDSFSIEATLQEQITYARSESQSDRRKQINGIIKSLHKSEGVPDQLE